jgi:hypothetical protein
MSSNTSSAVATTSAAAVAIQYTLTPAEMEQANLHLEQTRNGAIGAIQGLSEAQWRYKPGPGVWSIAENLEHIAFVQERVLNVLRNHLATAPAGPDDRNYQLVDAVIINQFPNRLAKFQAPEVIRPQGNCVLSEARERVAANTRSFAECLETIPDLRGHVLESPPLKAVSKGEHQVMDGYQFILAASAHTERHTKQILEVRADPNFPAS